jgi:hypothetical protein
MCDVIMLNAHACFGAKEDTPKQLFHSLRWPWHHSPAVLLLPFVCLLSQSFSYPSLSHENEVFGASSTLVMEQWFSGCLFSPERRRGCQERSLSKTSIYSSVSEQSVRTSASYNAT